MDKTIKDFNIRLRTIKIRELLISLVISVIFVILMAIIFPEVLEDENLFAFVATIPLILFLIYALNGTKGLKDNFNNLFEENNLKEILFVLITNLLFMYLIILSVSTLDILSGINDPTWISMWDIDSVTIDSGVIIIDAITAIIFAPVLEEIIFRGILFNRLKIRTGIIPAMIISSFIFAIGHGFGGITSAFLFGISMCILYLKTDNILIPMSIHFLNNLIVTVLDLFNFDATIGQLPWLVPCIIISLIGTFYLIKYIVKESRMLKKQYN